MNALTFTIELVEPMMATGLEGDPNAEVSMHYIAGSVLRGAIINLFQREKRKTDKSYEIDATETEARNLFFDGNVCFLNAYPLIQIDRSNNVRSFPVPQSWHKRKDCEEIEKTRFDFTITSAEEQEKLNPEDKRQFKGLTARYFAFKNDDSGSEIIKAEIKTRITVHTQRDAKKGRATKDNGAVFRYESVEKKTKFGGAIVSDNIGFLNQIKTLLENLEDSEIIIGGSKTGGYGKAKIILTPPIDTNFQESTRTTVKKASANGIESSNSQDSGFSITLLSNTLIRDENGQFQADLTTKSLGLNKSDITSIKEKTFKKAELVGGFNRKWGVPLPQMLSLKAGSVFTFTANSKIEAATIRNWLENGIGERKLDGFGRIAVNFNTTADLSFKDKSTIPAIEFPLTSASGKKNGQIIVDRIFKQKLDAKLIDNLAIYDAKISEKNNHQISRLREFIHAILRDESLDTLEKVHTEIKNEFFQKLKSKAKDQFEKIKIKDAKIESWMLDDVLSENFNLFNQDKITLGKDATKVESETQNQTTKYRLLLIDKVLERAAKGGLS